MGSLKNRDNQDYKLNVEWGEKQALRLWNTLHVFNLDWKGKTILDFGCSWGYLDKFLIEQQGVATSYGVDIDPIWKLMDATVYTEPKLKLFSGNILEIPDIQDITFDIIVTSGTLMLIPPTTQYNILKWFYEHLKPGGYCIIGTRSYLSQNGGDLQWEIKTPLPHLLFSRKIIEDYLTSKNKPISRYMSPLCAASYLTLYHRVGFNLFEARRVYNSLDESVYQQFSDKLGFYDPQELRTTELITLLHKPKKSINTENLEKAVIKDIEYNRKRKKLVDLEAKKSIELGNSQAHSLWENLYSRYIPSVNGQTVLDLGCSWGYLLKYLSEKFTPSRLIGVDIKPDWNSLKKEWDYSKVQFCTGNLFEINQIPQKSIDLILCSSVLQYMTPEEIESNLTKAYVLLRPGGEMILRTHAFTSYIGADIHRDVELPYDHLLYREKDITRFMMVNRGQNLPYVNWLTASTYLSIFVRTGFEIIDARRRMNSVSPEVMRVVTKKFPWIAPNELLCSELEARLIRPIEPNELTLFGDMIIT